jgi:hypothetical protein
VKGATPIVPKKPSGDASQVLVVSRVAWVVWGEGAKPPKKIPGMHVSVCTCACQWARGWVGGWVGGWMGVRVYSCVHVCMHVRARVRVCMLVCVLHACVCASCVRARVRVCHGRMDGWVCVRVHELFVTCACMPASSYHLPSTAQCARVACRCDSACGTHGAPPRQPLLARATPSPHTALSLCRPLKEKEWQAKKLTCRAPLAA